MKDEKDIERLEFEVGTQRHSVTFSDNMWHPLSDRHGGVVAAALEVGTPQRGREAATALRLRGPGAGAGAPGLRGRGPRGPRGPGDGGATEDSCGGGLEGIYGGIVATMLPPCWRFWESRK